MSDSDAKQVVVTFIEKVWNSADLAAFDELTTETYVYCLGGQPARDRAAMKQFLQTVHSAFPDWRVHIEDVADEGNTVAVRWTGEVTHGGEFHSIPATNKRILVCGLNMYTVDNGRISKEWEQMDSLGMMQQLGVLPPPAPRACNCPGA